MSYWFDYLVEKERRRHEMAQADAHRRTKHIFQADATQRPRAQLQHRFLAFVGQWLIDLGCRLQQRSTGISVATTGLVQEPILRPKSSTQCGC